jgi:hypothetical protein
MITVSRDQRLWSTGGDMMVGMSTALEVVVAQGGARVGHGVESTECGGAGGSRQRLGPTYIQP